MYARDFKRQHFLVRLYAYAFPYVYTQGFLLRHSHINLLYASTCVAAQLGIIILSYAHTDFAVLFAAADTLDTVATVEAKRQELCRLLSFWHAFDFICFIMNDMKHYFHASLKTRKYSATRSISWIGAALCARCPCPTPAACHGRKQQHRRLCRY